MEEWRPIKGYAKWYEVSSLGYVRRVSDKKLLKRVTSGQGYLQVCLYAGGKHGRLGKFLPIHRLVCEAWNGPPPFEDAQALHRDDNRVRNVPLNIYWGTAQDNADDRKRNTLAHMPLGI